MSAETADRDITSAGIKSSGSALETRTSVDKPTEEEPFDSTEQSNAKRYHGSVILDGTRVVRDASQIAEEVVVHLTSLLGADVKLTLHIEAKIPSGVPKRVERIVIENSRTLNFDDSGFESE